MNLEEIKLRVAEIEEKQDEGDEAHRLEDALYADFIKFIRVSGSEKQRSMAIEILKTEEMDFGRWYS